MFSCIEEIKIANKQINNYWFENKTMRFFNSVIESKVLYGWYFITSERTSEILPRKYTIRKALPTGKIENVGKFQKYDNVEDAKKSLLNILN